MDHKIIIQASNGGGGFSLRQFEWYGKLMGYIFSDCHSHLLEMNMMHFILHFRVYEF